MSEKAKESSFYSRSALADKLGLSLKVLTQSLLDGGWLRNQDNKWQLTSKGEFEGGLYRSSKKYGEYIVWPESVLQHPLLTDIEQPQLSASHIGRRFQIMARQVNALFTEQGLIERDVRGWHLTDFGQWAGGSLHTHERSGATYALWQKDLLLKLPELEQELAQLGWANNLDTEALAQPFPAMALDGQPHACRALKLIGDWLYLAGIGHSCNRPLPRQRQLHSQFYLPDCRVYIELWGLQLSPADIAEQLSRQEYYLSEQVRLISLQLKDIAELDERLARELLNFEVKAYQHL